MGKTSKEYFHGKPFENPAPSNREDEIWQTGKEMTQLPYHGAHDANLEIKELPTVQLCGLIASATTGPRVRVTSKKYPGIRAR